eukprot:2227311-Rhodomonas_salina.1
MAASGHTVAFPPSQNESLGHGTHRGPSASSPARLKPASQMQSSSATDATCCDVEFGAHCTIGPPPGHQWSTRHSKQSPPAR